jgi:glycosyltransferase involved in cell wall biosynthesis
LTSGTSPALFFGSLANPESRLLEKKMRLAVLNLTASGMSGGYRSYLQNIVPRLAADSRVRSVLCCSLASLRVEEWISHNEKIQFADCQPFTPLGRRLDRDLENRLSSFSPDVIFAPTARAVRYRHVPVVTMIQNMAPLCSWRSYGLTEWPRLAAQRLETFRAVRQAAGVIAISNFVRQFLLREWGVAEGKIFPIYFGAPLPAVNPVRPSQLPSGWRDFIFTAGSIEPYRSLEDVISCAEHSRKKMGRPLRVAIAGQARESMKPYELRLKDRAIKAGVSADICWMGQLSSSEMTWCYKNCLAFVMTSRIEACPNTVLEAMACGSVCIAADNEPLPELFSEAALYYTPGSGKMLAAQVEEVASLSNEEKTRISISTYERSRKFTWEAAAEKTVDLFARISGIL